MNPNYVQAHTVPINERVELKLLALFLLTFVGVFVLAWLFDLMGSYTASREAEDAIVVQPTVVVIDPKIQTELARVMSYSEPAFAGQISDPFNDRTGISNIARTAGISASSSSSVTSDAGGSPATASQRAGNSGGGGGTTTTVPAVPTITPLEATRVRYENWLEQARLGAVQEIDPRIFSIEDLMPVGVVSGGEGIQEVMFYSQVAEKTLSFPVGTRFFDGWLSELRPEGVVFSFVDVDRTVRMRSWARSIKGIG